MNKIWYTFIDNKREGPWSFEDLKSDIRITPDTLVWKDGFEDWKKIRDVPELEKLFEEPKTNVDETLNQEELEKKPVQDELVLEMGQVEPPYYFWLILALIALLYLVIQFFFQ